MPTTNSEPTQPFITQIMKDKHCKKKNPLRECVSIEKMIVVNQQ
jgi:hypothetical protein